MKISHNGTERDMTAEEELAREQTIANELAKYNENCWKRHCKDEVGILEAMWKDRAKFSDMPNVYALLQKKAQEVEALKDEYGSPNPRGVE